MKRSSQKISDRKLKTLSSKKSAGFLNKNQLLSSLLPLIELEDSRSNCVSVASYILESIKRSVESIIDKIQQKERQRNLLGFVQSYEKIIENGLYPFIDSKEQFSQPDEQIKIISCDNLCKGDAYFIPKISSDQIKKSYCTPKEYTCSHSFKEFERQNIEVREHGLVPLAGAQSMKDIKTLQLQNAYRQKFMGRTSVENQEILRQVRMYQQRFKSNQKKQNQYNFDYDGEKIIVNPFTIAKNFQINILKPFYRINKDRHDIKKDKKKEVVTSSKLPKVMSRTTFHCTPQEFNFKSSIQKCINQRNCKISSIKLIQKDKK